MFIDSVSHYLPARVTGNDHFARITGLTEEWLESRTGIKERRKAEPHENANTMAVASVKSALGHLSYSIQNVDLIIGATYTPYDTVGTIAHSLQQAFDIPNAQAFTISSACASFLNALEIAEGYFALDKASLALIAAAEHNSAYNDESDVQSGHLWGDGAAAVFVSKKKISEEGFEVVDILTKGLGNAGKSIDGVWLRPNHGGLKMPFGRDVFIHANKYMVSVLKEILDKNHLTVKDIDFLIPHQANLKIIRHVQHDLEMPDNKILINIDKLGNTGCASIPIALAQNEDKFHSGDLIALTVFGGGYSGGAALLKKL